MTNIELAAGLRAVAEFYETHPDMPLPYPELNIFAGGPSDAHAIKSKMGEAAIEESDKGSSYPEWHLKRDFGGVILHGRAYMGHIGRKVMKNMLVETWELIPAMAEEPAHKPLDCKDAECATCNELSEGA